MTEVNEGENINEEITLYDAGIDDLRSFFPYLPARLFVQQNLFFL
jgi:hypothetical protein